MMGLLFVMTLRAVFHQRGHQEVMSPSFPLPGVRMSPFWIRHKSPSGSRLRSPRPVAFGLGVRSNYLTLFFEFLQWGPAIVCSDLSATARSQIPILAALRTKPGAVRTADDLDRDRQQNLFFYGVLQPQTVPVIEADVQVGPPRLAPLLSGGGL